MKLYDYYKATFPGEIKEKIKRKIFIKLNKVKKKVEIPENLKINYEFLNKGVKNENIEIEFENTFNIFNKQINLLEDFNWEIQEEDKNIEWYNVNVKKYGDIKYTWEKSRLQFLLPLVIYGKKERALEILDFWIEKNKFEKGPNWNSNLEVAIRAISMINMLVAINNKKIHDRYKNVLYYHAVHIYEDINYTEKCIPNNHLVGEASALYCLSKFLDCKESENWEKKSKKILKKYLYHIREDGTYMEGSISYHMFYLQMYVMVYIFSKKTNSNFIESEIEEKLKKSYIFLSNVEKNDKTYPNFGDNDEGYFYKVFFKNERSKFIASLKNLFEDNRNEGYKDEMNILKKIYSLDIHFSKCELKEKRYYENGKFVVVKDNENYLFINNQEQIYHSHSDGLSLELSLNKKNIFVDSGTYNYNLEKEKRKYYRGTRAHNTVYMGEDQSLQIGSFRWINTAKSDLIYKEKEKKIDIIGNVRTITGKKQTRTLILEEDFSEIKITDRILNVGEFELNWHLGEKIELKKINEKEYLIENTDYKLIFEYEFEGEIEIKKSYISNQYGEEQSRLNIALKNLKERKEYIIKTILKKYK